MKYNVKNADAEGLQFADNKLVKNLERTVRCSSVLIGALGLSLIALAVYTTVLVLTEYKTPRPCLSEECVGTASRILLSMNRDVDPCQDFYEFACGGWIKRNPVPKWAGRWHQLAKLREQLSTDLTELLEEDDVDGLPTSVLKAKTFYRTCMSHEPQEESMKPMEKFLQELGLPARPPAQASENFTWEATAGRGRRLLGLNVLLSLQVADDVRNNSRNLMTIRQVSPGFSERYLLEPTRFADELKVYHKYIEDLIAEVDPDTDAQKFADDIVEFSKSLAKIMSPEEERRSPNHLNYEMTLEQLIQGEQVKGTPVEWKKHDWEMYLDQVFANTSVTLHLQDRVMITELSYLQKLAVVLADTEPVLIERFLWWRMYKELRYLSSKRPHGEKKLTPRGKICTTRANENFGEALGYLYVKRHFDQDSQQKAIEMIEDVRESFAESVQQLEWMDSSTKAAALNKLKAIRNFVGFPAWLLTNEQLDKYYEHVEVIEGKFFETSVNLASAAVKKSLESLREAPDRNKWISKPTTVNAFYSTILNSVMFPAGILQPPFFDNGLEAINYGSIGALMGHEITHGFDNQGRQYDEEGNLKQWWSVATLERYQGKVQCIIDQYSKYHMPELPNYTVDGFNTQGENIADNGGLRAALGAYRRYLTRTPHAARDVLPAFTTYTPEQLFFLGFAQIWCGNATLDALKYKIVQGLHSPNKLRVMGTLSNMDEFAHAWQCTKGSPMNPEHKCVLW